MKLMKYTDYACENAVETQTLYLNGYDFGDRLLEDVPFEITIADGKLVAKCLNKYEQGIDWAYWERVCAEYALDNDDMLQANADMSGDGFIQFKDDEHENELAGLAMGYDVYGSMGE